MKISELNTKNFLGAAGAATNSYVLVNYEDNSTNEPITYKATIDELGKAIANNLGLVKSTQYGEVTTTVNNGAYVDGTPKYLVSQSQKEKIDPSTSSQIPMTLKDYFASTGAVTSAVSGLASTGYVTNAVAGKASTGAVTAAVNGLASTGYVTSAVNSAISDFVAPSKQASQNYVLNAVRGLPSVGYVTSTATATVNAALVEFAGGDMASAINDAVDGLASEGYVASAINAYGVGGNEYVDPADFIALVKASEEQGEIGYQGAEDSKPVSLIETILDTGFRDAGSSTTGRYVMYDQSTSSLMYYDSEALNMIAQTVSPLEIQYSEWTFNTAYINGNAQLVKADKDQENPGEHATLLGNVLLYELDAQNSQLLLKSNNNTYIGSITYTPINNNA